jgi:hypothetical protein
MVQVIPNIMSTLSVMKWSCEVVQKDKSVSTSACSLRGHDSLCTISAKEAVLMVPKNQPICNSQNSINLAANSTFPAFLFGDSITCHSRLSLHCLVEALIITRHDMSNCICSMHHVLTRSSMYIMLISISCHPPSDTGGTTAHT